ncbi:hypothetical protein [Phenylobacterium sp.]|uniref:hypothetical protein n=1 Tax=Phenylobacterium sp. TaxID=1871053 RepID=UPI001200420F|nr:hypothetical protein [Phenylobacterium sp.]THD63917.1 MAG: hypothetical protein E8A49_04395 [Phenylobacterium sp.]
MLALFVATASTAVAADYKAPRTHDGHPSLEGHWTNTSLTMLERPRDLTSLVLSEDQARRAAQVRNQAGDRDSQPTDPQSPAPQAGRDVGGYNAFWTDAGTSFAKVHGEYRSSWLIDPAGGKLPYTEEGKRMFTAAFNQQRTATSDPELRSLGERCLLGFGSSAGPPMLNVSYNNIYQIVQTPREVVVFSEMIHDARIVRMDAPHQPSSMRRWMGDAIGHWDGDTLVIETTNMHPQESMRVFYGQSLYISQDAKITERLTRISDKQLLYRFEVDDPRVYSKTWRAEMVFNATDEPSYEYACHEGNYSMPGILGAGRKDEEPK